MHTKTDRCTIILYTANAIETKTAAKLLALDWTREPSRGKHGIYLIHDGIHYNAIRLRDNQEEDEQNKDHAHCNFVVFDWAVVVCYAVDGVVHVAWPHLEGGDFKEGQHRE